MRLTAKKKDGQSKFQSFFTKWLFFVVILCSCHLLSIAQPVLPQRSLTAATASQGIHFGTFCLSGPSGGTITVGYDGSRSCSSGILLLGKSPSAHPAIFDVKLCDGRVVSINYDTPIQLSGSNGGFFTLNLGPTDKGTNGSTFVTGGDCNFISQIRMGGTLTVPGTAVPGTYSGIFSITFNQQ
jgi:hypothetical protein